METKVTRFSFPYVSFEGGKNNTVDIVVAAAGIDSITKMVMNFHLAVKNQVILEFTHNGEGLFKLTVPAVNIFADNGTTVVINVF